MDEVLTPDSSRFWSIDTYQEGINPPSLINNLYAIGYENSGWNKTSSRTESARKYYSENC